MILPFEEMRGLFRASAMECSTWNTADGDCLCLEKMPTREQYGALSAYTELLLRWNEKINLTAIVDPAGISEKHFLDSVLPLAALKIPQGAAIIDVGTGAGFPGIPMKIVRKDLKLTLLDSLNKRIAFLSEVSDKLSLDARCIHARAEDAARGAELREKFDVATARAVAKLPVLCEYCLPFVRVGGIFIALKGPNENVSASDAAIKLLGGRLETAKGYRLPCGDERMLIVIRKISQTPTKFPRNSGQIAKNSL